MKKNLFSLSAVLVAIVFSAFTTSTLRVDSIFEFTGNPLISTEVQDPAKWQFVSQEADDLTCDDLNKVACKIRVPASQVNPNNTLKSNTVIAASPYTFNSITTYYVSGGTHVLAFSNQDR